MFAGHHVDKLAEEFYSFELEPFALFERGGSPEFDVSARADDAMPRKSVCRVAPQEAGDSAVV